MEAYGRAFVIGAAAPAKTPDNDQKPIEIEFAAGEEGWPLIEALEREVYPPAILAAVPWRDIVWSHADTRVLVRREGQIVCHAGIYRREGTADGKPVRIGGIGGVMTAPAHRGTGCASAAMKAATGLLFDECVDFCFLFCEPHNVGFYRRLGWRPFAGETFCQQPSGRVSFTVMGAMSLGAELGDVRAIDLCGRPW